MMSMAMVNLQTWFARKSNHFNGFIKLQIIDVSTGAVALGASLVALQHSTYCFLYNFSIAFGIQSFSFIQIGTALVKEGRERGKVDR